MATMRLPMKLCGMTMRAAGLASPPRAGLVDVQDELCALPYDTYTLEELPCEGNQGYELVKIPNITISRNNTTIELGTIDDQFEGVPEIATTATGGRGARCRACRGGYPGGRGHL